ncbi:MAG: type I restriction endonuclease subunit M, partial [Candidatus Sedimenticola sp. (ex Thyasira tokunagai)]
DMYQIIMDYWAEVMQDDVYFITQDGWPAANTLRELVVKKGEKLKETPDLIINRVKYKAELIPPALIVQRFFAEEQRALDALQAALDSATQELEAYIEEHAIEGGLLEEALTDSGKVNKGSVTARLKQATDAEEITALKQVKKRIDAEATQKKQLKAAREALDKKVFLQCPKLTEADNKTLIAEDKWLATLQGNIIAEIERVTQQLANRVKTLEERYETPLPELTAEAATLSVKVEEHLRKMGLQW